MLASPGRVATVRRLWTSNLGNRRNCFSGYAHLFEVVVLRHVVGDYPEERRQRFGPPACVGPEAVSDVWTWLHKLRSAMVRPGRDLLTGRVEVDETYLGGLEEGLRGQPAELQKSRQAILPPGAAGGGCRARAVRRNRSADPPDSPKSITTSCRAYLSEAHTHLGLFRSLPTVSCPIDEAFRQAARNCATLAAPVSPRILHLNPQLFRPVQTWLKPLSRRR